MGVSVPKLDISTIIERKWNICLSESKFGHRPLQPKPNQISKIEDVSVVKLFVKHFAFFYSPGIITRFDYLPSRTQK